MARRAFSLGLLTAVAMVALLTFGAPAADAQKKGGVLRVGNLGEPPDARRALDHRQHHRDPRPTTSTRGSTPSTATTGRSRCWPRACPRSAGTASRYTIKLRQGVTFHNGKEMTSEDVVASLTRWGKQSIYGKALFAQVADLRGRGQVHGRAEAQGAVAHRADGAGGAQQLRRDLSQGDRREVPAPGEDHRVRRAPVRFRLAEWKPDQYIRMVRFDDYKPRSEKPERLRRRQDRVATSTRSAGSRRPRWPPGWPQLETGRARLRRRPDARLLRPPAAEPGRAAPGRQAVLLAHGRLQQEGRPDDEPEAAPGLAGGPRHRADHEERGRRQAGVLPPRQQPRSPARSPEWHTKIAGPARGTSTTRPRPSAAAGGRATRASRSAS